MCPEPGFVEVTALTAVVVRRGGRGPALVIAVLLAASAALALLAPVVGVVHTNDGSTTAAASGAIWVMAIPAVVVLALAFVRPVAAIAAGAGLGLVAASRLFADLSLLLTPDGVARPELWVETTDHALPVTPALGSYLVLAADLVALAAGILGAIRLSGMLSFQRDSDFAGTPIDPPADGFATAPDAVAEARPDFARFDRMDRAVRRNNVMTLLGLLGALMLTVGALGVPYTGGYLAARFLPPSIGVAGLVGALVLAVIAATAVLVAGTLPRSLAVALLGGTALGGALPLLVALVAVASTPTNLTTTVWIGLAGAAILTLAGLLARVRLLDVGVGEGSGPGPDGDGSVRPPSRALDVAIGIGAVVAGGLSVAAYLLPPINAGGLEDLLFLTDGSPVPGSTVFAAAAVPLLVAGVVALVPRIGAAGRGGATLGWAGVVFAVTGALEVLGDDGLSTARAIGLISIGAGLWCGFAAAGIATVVAILAIVSLARASDSADTVDDHDSVGAARSASVPMAVVVALIAVLASCLPTFATSGQISSPTILRGYAVDTWGVWAMLLATIGALIAATLADRPVLVLGLLLGAALVAAVRMVIPAHVEDATGFGLRPGYAVQAVLVLALASAALLLARNAARIVRVPVDTYGSVFLDATPSGAKGSGTDRRAKSGAARGATRAAPTGGQGQGSTSKGGRKRR